MLLVLLQSDDNDGDDVYKSQDVDLGSHILIQTVDCSLYAVFQFPPKAPLKACEELTVYSGSAGTGPCQHEPKNHYFYTSQPRWASGPCCVTILSRPDDKVRPLSRIDKIQRFRHLERHQT